MICRVITILYRRRRYVNSLVHGGAIEIAADDLDRSCCRPSRPRTQLDQKLAVQPRELLMRAGVGEVRQTMLAPSRLPTEAIKLVAASPVL